MVEHSASPASPRRANDRAWAVLGGFLLVAIVLLAGAVVAFVTVGRGWRPDGQASVSFLYPEPTDAPAIDLVDQDGQPFSLASLRGSRVLVFFGYTHCPDVCPATVGTVGKVLEGAGPATRAVFVSIDPERDTPVWLKDYVRYIPPGFTAATGTVGQVRAVADAWGVRYAKVDTGTPGAYSMTHTAEVYLVDARGRLRAHFPFGTAADAMLGVVRSVPAWAAAPVEPPTAAQPVPPSASTASAPSPGASGTSPGRTPGASAAPGGATVQPVVVSTSVWAGGRSPVIMSLFRDGAGITDPSTRATVQLVDDAGGPLGAPVEAVAVRPPGVPDVWFVASVDIPAPGLWRLVVNVAAGSGGLTASGSVSVSALDPGSTPQLGAPAPDVHTPSLADVGGDPRGVTTDPNPDPRLSQTSTSDARAAHRPYVLVVDSYRFKVTAACGKALLMARYLADRWPDVAFIHLEPYRYSIVTDSVVLDGALGDPPLTPIASAWGLGSGPWSNRSVPWIFVVDGDGTVVAKYQGVVGSADIDVILAMLGNGS